MQQEGKPSPVSEQKRTKQGGEIRARWEWTEPEVWTERMLAALERGVKGGKWFSLMDKVYAPKTLAAAFKRVKGNSGAAGVDNQNISMFETSLEKNLHRLHEELRMGKYHPQGVRRVWIPKPGGSREKRPLGIPTVRDRVVQTALRYVIEPIIERGFAEHSYGFRPRRGCKDALRQVEQGLKAGYHWVVDADLRSFFDTIPHDNLMKRVKEKIADGRVLTLIEQYLQQKALEGLKEWTPEEGTPQGAVISPLLANLYLNPLDHKMERKKYKMIRYADDFVILCQSKTEAEQALREVERWVEKNGLSLHPEKTRLVDAREVGGFDFLGYHFERGMKWPRKKSVKKFRDTIRAKTQRKQGRSMAEIVKDVNRTTKGWFEYFKHSKRNTFISLDGWVRMRLRSILRRRIGNKGRGRGADHQRWPNAYFTELGLFSMYATHVEVCQSARR